MINCLVFLFSTSCELHMQGGGAGGGSDGNLGTIDPEETDVEYDENVDAHGGGRRPNRSRHHARHRRGHHASSSQPDQYRYAFT